MATTEWTHTLLILQVTSGGFPETGHPAGIPSSLFSGYNVQIRTEIPLPWCIFRYDPIGSALSFSRLAAYPRDKYASCYLPVVRFFLASAAKRTPVLNTVPIECLSRTQRCCRWWANK